MKYCTACKQIGKCYYCAKYGDKGVHMQLEKLKLINKPIINYQFIDIHKLQLSRFNKN